MVLNKPLQQLAAEGRLCGTTSVLECPSQNIPHRVSVNTLTLYRAFPSNPTKTFRLLLRSVFIQSFLRPSTNRALSVRKASVLLFSFMAFFITCAV